MSTWKRDVASGLVVLVPLLVIAVVLNWLYQQLTEFPLVRTIQLTGVEQLPAEIVPLVRVFIALVVFTMLVLAVGYLMRTRGGQFIEDRLDDFINRVPILRVLYNASKLAVETALTGTDELQKPVRLEVWPNIRMTAFKTGKRTEDGREVLFMPTAPNITTGFVMEVPPEEIEETDERVEEALTRILSAGFGDTDEPTEIDVMEELADDSADRVEVSSGDSGETRPGDGQPSSE